jgi:hypothetical protein
VMGCVGNAPYDLFHTNKCMTKYLLIFLFVLSSLIAFSQPGNKNIFKTIEYTFDSANLKPTIYYTVVSWCGANLDDLILLKDSIIKYRNNFHLVILLDSNLRHKPKYFNCLKEYTPDTIIYLNPFFPTCFWKKREARWYAQQVNESFSTNFKMVGPGALFARFRNRSYFFSLSRIVEFPSFLRSMGK